MAEANIHLVANSPSKWHCHYFPRWTLGGKVDVILILPLLGLGLIGVLCRRYLGMLLAMPCGNQINYHGLYAT